MCDGSNPSLSSLSCYISYYSLFACILLHSCIHTNVGGHHNMIMFDGDKHFELVYTEQNMERRRGEASSAVIAMVRRSLSQYSCSMFKLLSGSLGYR
jgi:hypothetical protein